MRGPTSQQPPSLAQVRGGGENSKVGLLDPTVELHPSRVRVANVERDSVDELSARVIYRVQFTCGCTLWEYRRGDEDAPARGEEGSCYWGTSDHSAASRG